MLRLAIALAGLGLVDLLLVRHIGWAIEHVHGTRFLVNFGLSLFVLAVTLSWLSGLRRRQPR